VAVLNIMSIAALFVSNGRWSPGSIYDAAPPIAGYSLWMFAVGVRVLRQARSGDDALPAGVSPLAVHSSPLP
jgi:hypothetical protein